MQNDLALERRHYPASEAVSKTVLAGRIFEPQALNFEVKRNGAVIGEHKIRVYRDRLNWLVDTDIEWDIGWAFIKTDRFQHRNREVWDSVGLLRFDSVTNDNSEKRIVSAERFGDQIRVASSQGVIAVPHDSLPTTYWQRRFTDEDRWIDTQYGRIVESNVTAKGVDRVQVMGEVVEAERFVLTGDLDLELWYCGWNWVKMRCRAPDGSIINLDLSERRGNILEGDLSEILAG